MANTSALTNASSRQMKEAVLLATVSRTIFLLTMVSYSYKTVCLYYFTPTICLGFAAYFKYHSSSTRLPGNWNKDTGYVLSYLLFLTLSPRTLNSYPPPLVRLSADQLRFYVLVLHAPQYAHTHTFGSKHMRGLNMHKRFLNSIGRRPS